MIAAAVFAVLLLGVVQLGRAQSTSTAAGDVPVKAALRTSALGCPRASGALLRFGSLPVASILRLGWLAA